MAESMEVRAIKFPPATLEWLRQRAFALSTADVRVSLAQVVRDAVEEARQREEATADECPVCHDTYTDAAGVAEHLASNRKGCGEEARRRDEAVSRG